MSTINTDVFIIGGGPAGMFAAFNCGLLGMRAVLVECLSSLGGQCMQVYKDKLIHDIPGFAKIKAGDFIHHLEEQLNQFSCISYIFSQQITNIQKVEAGFQAIINDITVISKKVIFATGAGKMIPNKPNLPNLNPLERLGHVKYFIEKKILYIIMKKLCGL